MSSEETSMGAAAAAGVIGFVVVVFSLAAYFIFFIKKDMPDRYVQLSDLELNLPERYVGIDYSATIKKLGSDKRYNETMKKMSNIKKEYKKGNIILKNEEDITNYKYFLVSYSKKPGSKVCETFIILSKYKLENEKDNIQNGSNRKFSYDYLLGASNSPGCSYRNRYTSNEKSFTVYDLNSELEAEDYVKPSSEKTVEPSLDETDETDETDVGPSPDEIKRQELADRIDPASVKIVCNNAIRLEATPDDLADNFIDYVRKYAIVDDNMDETRVFCGKDNKGTGNPYPDGVRCGLPDNPNGFPGWVGFHQDIIKTTPVCIENFKTGNSNGISFKLKNEPDKSRTFWWTANLNLKPAEST